MRWCCGGTHRVASEHQRRCAAALMAAEASGRTADQPGLRQRRAGPGWQGSRACSPRAVLGGARAFLVVRGRVGPLS